MAIGTLPPDRASLSYGSIILTYAERHRERLTLGYIEKIQEMLLDLDFDHEDIVLWLKVKLNLNSNELPSARRLITEFAKELLTDEQRNARRIHRQTKNSRKRLERGGFDFAAYGRISGEEQAEKWKQSGKNPAGSDLWPDDQVRALQTMIDDPENQYKEGPLKGRPQIKKIHESLTGPPRTVNAIRMMAKRLRAAAQSALENVESQDVA